MVIANKGAVASSNWNKNPQARKAIKTEQEKSYRQIERKQAAQRFPVEKEKHLIVSTLEEALNGAKAKELLPKLVHLPRRGRR